MYNIYKSTAAAALAIGLSAGAASAATVTVFGTFSNGFTVDQFNISGATLESVDIRFNATAVNESSPASATVSFQGFSASDPGLGGGFATALLVATDTTDLFEYVGAGTLSGTVVADAILFQNSTFVNDPFVSQFIDVASLEVTYNYLPAAPIPLPAGAPLLVAGLGGLALLRKKRKS